jgi:DNA-binding winged helix-turn-helix (wHTH) protein
MTDTPAIRFGRFTLHPASRSLQQDAQPVAIGARAFDVLAALVERRDRVVGKNELLDVVWPGVVVEENNLQVHISALRKLLGPQAIATIPGRGYRFVVPLDGDGGRPARVETPAPGARGQRACVRRVHARQPAQIVPPLFGRDVALPALRALIDRQALVTLVGAALGTALARAGHVLRVSPDGAGGSTWRAGRSGPGAGGALRRRWKVGHGAEQLLGAWRLVALLVLDNCEHVVDAAAAPAAILERAGGIRLLVTNRSCCARRAHLQLRRWRARCRCWRRHEFGPATVERARAVEPPHADAGVQRPSPTSAAGSMACRWQSSGGRAVRLRGRAGSPPAHRQGARHRAATSAATSTGAARCSRPTSRPSLATGRLRRRLHAQLANRWPDEHLDAGPSRQARWWTNRWSSPTR